MLASGQRGWTGQVHPGLLLRMHLLDSGGDSVPAAALQLVVSRVSSQLYCQLSGWTGTVSLPKVLVEKAQALRAPHGGRALRSDLKAAGP